jgi:hypothetical protein
MGDDARPALGVQRLVVGEGVEVVRGVLRDQFGNVEVSGS